MTKEDLHPGLGSGALREALEKRIIASLTQYIHQERVRLSGVYSQAFGAKDVKPEEVAKYENQTTAALANAIELIKIEFRDAAALSLSSPIEPSMASERTIAIRNAYERGKKDGLAAQASSEIREATSFEKTAAALDKMARRTTILAMELAYKCLQSFTIQSTHPDAARVRDICYTLLGTKHHRAEPDETGEWMLAPSRQGAGGK